MLEHRRGPSSAQDAAGRFQLMASTLDQRLDLRGVLCVSVAQSCLSLCDVMDCNPPGSSVHGDSPGRNTGVGCHALPHGILLTHGLNPGVLYLLE